MKRSIFWDITLCSPLKVNRCFGGTCRLQLQGRRISPARNQRKSRWQAELTLVSCSAYSSTLKMEAMFSSKTSVNFQRTTQRYIPEDSALYNHRCENLKSSKSENVSNFQTGKSSQTLSLYFSFLFKVTLIIHSIFTYHLFPFTHSILHGIISLIWFSNFTLVHKARNFPILSLFKAVWINISSIVYITITLTAYTNVVFFFFGFVYFSTDPETVDYFLKFFFGLYFRYRQKQVDWGKCWDSP
jgi:hypothetical protein